MADPKFNSRIEVLSGAVNGVNRQFGTPTAFQPGRIRVIWNGQIYEPGDDKWGWTELSDTTVELDLAPRTGDVIEAHYLEKDTAGQIGVEGVVGSPFHPTGLLP